MILEQIQYPQNTYLFEDIEHVMTSIGFVRGGWDYSHATYDYKMTDEKNKAVYYLRVRSVVTEGKLEKKDAKLQLLTPTIERHYYPHGLDQEAVPPAPIQKTAEELMARLLEKIKS